MSLDSNSHAAQTYAQFLQQHQGGEIRISDAHPVIVLDLRSIGITIPDEKKTHPAAQYLARIFAIGELFESELGRSTGREQGLMQTWHTEEELRAFSRKQKEAGITREQPAYRWEPEPNTQRLRSALARAESLMSALLMLLDDGYTGESHTDYIASRAAEALRGIGINVAVAPGGDE
jgi:hypothetical protein